MTIEEKGIQPVLMNATAAAWLADPAHGPAGVPFERRADREVEVVVGPDVRRAAVDDVDRAGSILDLRPGRAILGPKVLVAPVRPFHEVPRDQTVEGIGA